jgi:hypothetical protein
VRTLIMGALAVAALGCGGASEVDDRPFGVTGKGDSLSPFSTFVATRPTIGRVLRLVLNEDRTFERIFLDEGCAIVGSCEGVTGTYRLTRAGSMRFIRFTDSQGQPLDRYAYKLTGDLLELRDPSDTTFFPLRRVDPMGQGDACGSLDLTCQDGLECTPTGDFGLCTLPLGGEGAPCGGPGPNAPGCEPGLTCVPSYENTVDAGGTCRVTCGSAVCDRGQLCCNPSCGLCTRPGEICSGDPCGA